MVAGRYARSLRRSHATRQGPPPTSRRLLVDGGNSAIKALLCPGATHPLRIPRRRNPEIREEALAAYRAARCALSATIRKSRASCWDELLSSLNTDPWERPYRIESTLNWGPGLGGPYELEEDEEISSNELQRAVKRIGSRKAPGPDGVLGKIWVWALDFLGERLRYIFNKCLRHGAFPQQWKQAELVLLPKEGKEEGTPSAYRPICLLDEVSKIFERIIAKRLVRHISREGGLHEEQYGFREGRSTVDAISRVTSLTEEAVEGGGVALAVLLDIANAFNTLPWDREPGVRHTRRTPMPTGNSMRGSAGVSLRTPTVESHIQPSPLPSSPSWLPRHLLCRRHISGGRGEQLGDTAAKAETAVAVVVQSITGMGLRVAAKKKPRLFTFTVNPLGNRQGLISGWEILLSRWGTGLNISVSYWTASGSLDTTSMSLPPR
ncbi:uncharacterized protein [Anoplolepis gracilipes]|uniref:uncharacterized protein n=1 Tax=Anoplolepis gracilipes TaxID=354296 RepID=UPI003BA2DD6F